MGNSLKNEEENDSPKTEISFYINNAKNKVVYLYLASVICIVLGTAFMLAGYPIGAIIVLVITILYLGYLAKLSIATYKNTLDSINDLANNNKKKEELINYFSHLIREPLNNIMIIGNILKESDTAKDKSDIIENLVTSAKNMVTAVESLTMRSAGNMILESRNKIRFNLYTAILNTVDLYNKRENRHFNFKIEENALSKTDCMGDPVTINQIFLDILDTVEKKTEELVDISISIQLKKLTNNRSLIGISMEINKPVSIFDPEKPMNSLTARLVSFEKGTYNQKIGKEGTTVSIFLPMEIAAEGAKKQVASQKMEELLQKEKTKKGLKDIKVLLAEDNPINREITLMTLKPLVKGIDSAVNGKEALELFGKSLYDIVLMDIQMPVMDGLTASQKIRELEASTNTHVPIIAITANAMLGDKEKCIAAGIDEYISKPFHPTLLIEKIKKSI